MTRPSKSSDETVAAREGRRGGTQRRQRLPAGRFGTPGATRWPADPCGNLAITLVQRWDDLTAASREVIGVLQRARRAAIQTGREVKVTVASEQGAYWIRFGSASARDSLRSGRFVLPPSITLRAMRERVVFRFDPKGPAFGDLLRVQSGIEAATIAVDQWTGTPYVRR